MNSLSNVDIATRKLGVWRFFLCLVCLNYCTALGGPNFFRYHHLKGPKLSMQDQKIVTAPSIFGSTTKLPSPAYPPTTMPQQMTSLFHPFNYTVVASDASSIHFGSQKKESNFSIDIPPPDEAAVMLQRNTSQNDKLSSGFETVSDYYVGVPRAANYIYSDTMFTNNSTAHDAPVPEQNTVQEFTCETTSDLLKRLNLNTFLKALVEKDLLKIVDNAEMRFTVFAPSDFAFQEFFKANGVSVDEFFGDKQLDKVLQYHIVGQGELMLDDLYAGLVVPTLLQDAEVVVDKFESSTIILSMKSGFEAVIVYPDVHACNSVVHVIDAVLLPDFHTTPNFIIG
eukprot:TRINITY_DN2277_c0_g3_i1.p1 TRINITY_DN2277_c0_g3~~TRINITY_DN2277_c0_g3_i1.p1  ORF type:complete len:339 (-),score=45.03 TRINITY_DN2277_c0_g3_i1:298-1314(-)